MHSIWSMAKCWDWLNFTSWLRSNNTQTDWDQTMEKSVIIWSHDIQYANQNSNKTRVHGVTWIIPACDRYRHFCMNGCVWVSDRNDEYAHDNLHKHYIIIHIKNTNKLQKSWTTHWVVLWWWLSVDQSSMKVGNTVFCFRIELYIL